MSSAKVSLFFVALVAGVALAQAAGGIKGLRQDDSQQRLSGLKGLRPPQQPQQQQQIQQIQQIPQFQQIAQQPQRPAPVKGAGQVAPVFQAARVQPAQQQIQQQIQQQQQQEQEPEQQQQQQETEIDPNAAAQDSAPSLLAPARPAASEEEANPRPEPYAFNYAFESGDSATSGSSQREETQDASGKVTGFYTLKGEDGRDRRVEYIADASGFRATITTNEMGTAPKDSADVNWQAQSPSDGQLRSAESATQAARQRALLNPQASASSSFAASTSSGKISSPRQNIAAPSAQRQVNFASASKTNQQIASQQTLSQLQEPFEQIRQTELNARARRASRHAPFYLFTTSA